MNNLEELKKIVDKIVEYTKTWSITESEWYWNIDCVRKSNYIKEEHITDKEFESAVREEILYDLVFNSGCELLNQMENDICNYSRDYGYEFSGLGLFEKESKELEKEVRKFIEDFKLERFDKNGNSYYLNSIK
jgi:hypothetical protein